jgi:hypothetical protein
MTETCAWCGELATTKAKYSYGKLPACDLCKAMVERKNLYMPCVINDKFESMTPAEQAKVYRATYWADLITNAEWPVVLGHEGVKRYVKSKLKKKAVGWVMALSRMLTLNPEFGAQVLREADALYREQIEQEPPIPWATLADLIEQGWVESSLGHWLQPLRNLRLYHPDAHARVVAEFSGPEDNGLAIYVLLPPPSNSDAEADPGQTLPSSSNTESEAA